MICPFEISCPFMLYFIFYLKIIPQFRIGLENTVDQFQLTRDCFLDKKKAKVANVLIVYCHSGDFQSVAK